jgi:hypothetical protein
VLAALRNAMSVLGEAMVLVAVPATCGYEARKMLLLTGHQTRGINYLSIQRCRTRRQRESRTQNHDRQATKKHKLTEVFFHKILHVANLNSKAERCERTIDPVSQVSQYFGGR